MTAHEDFSFLIPTYNREKYLQRILGYYANHDYKCRIVIADSSFDENKILNQKIIDSFPQLKINYLSFHLEVNPYQKLLDAINSVTTKYCVMCADDDFITPNSIKKCIDFLEKNPDYTAVGGYYYDFLAVKRRKKKIFYWKKYLLHSDEIKKHMTITSLKPSDRLSIHFANYYPTIYYIHRTDFLRIIYNEVLKNTTDVRFGELMLDMLTAIHGKIQTLDILYGARESMIASSTTTYSKLYQFILDGTFNEKYQKFSDCLVMHLTEEQKISKNDAENIVKKGIDSYIQLYHEGQKKSKVNRFRQFVRTLILKFKCLRINIKQYGKFSFKKQIDLKNWNLDDPPIEYLEDFKDIKETVLKTL